LLARTVSGDGKSAARVGGQLATASTLADLGTSFVEVHGQHQAQRLLSSGTQTAFLDRFAGDTHVIALAAFRDTWERWREARTALDSLAAASRERERELDLLAYQVREIEAVDPHEGETDRLTAEEARLAHVERLLERATEAETTLSGDGSLGDAAAGAANGLADAARLDPRAQGLAERARSLSTELAELVRDVRDYREGLSADPERLQEIRERRSALKGLQRK
jgi:DNA repair protein RecN (Recombination protein N)